MRSAAATLFCLVLALCVCSSLAVRLPVDLAKRSTTPNPYTQSQFEDICAAGTGTCLDTSTTRGCGNTECCEYICSFDQGQCCTSVWDEECVKLALWKSQCTQDNTFCEDAARQITLDGNGVYEEEHSNLHGATLQDYRSCGLVGSSVWYRFDATFDHTLLIDMCETTFDNVLVVYQSDDCPLPTDQLSDGCIDDCDGTCGFGSVYTLQAEAGETYWFQVGGFDASSGFYTLMVRDSAGAAERVWISGGKVFKWDPSNPGTPLQLTTLFTTETCTVAGGDFGATAEEIALLREGDMTFGECSGSTNTHLFYWDATNTQWTSITSYTLGTGSSIVRECTGSGLYYDSATTFVYSCDFDNQGTMVRVGSFDLNP